MSLPSFSFVGKLVTDYNGHCQLTGFYNRAKKHQNTWFEINFDKLVWIDANQSALLLAMIHKLRKERGLKFFIDYQALKGDLNILERNGFASYAVQSKKFFKKQDARESTVPIKAVKMNDSDKFVQYIEKSLLKHRGLHGINKDDKIKIKNSYFEIFDNVGLHANTKEPVLACGQFYPDSKTLIFTLVDFGQGFLKKIAEHTRGGENITSAAKAVSWAVKGNSTKSATKGGNGLNGILKYCLKKKSALHIVTDNCYWEFDGSKITNYKVHEPFPGTTIHLCFRYL